MSVDVRNIDQMLAELRAAAAIAQGKPLPPTVQAPQSTDFAQVLRSAIDQVSQAQTQAKQMSESFAVGDSNVSLQDVMINLQKANLSFQQMVQVRNRLVNAYSTIMNMPV